MNIVLIGYGKMGKAIEKIALEKHHKIVLKINQNNLKDLTAKNLEKADVAIEFTTPSSAIENIFTCFDASIPVVSGTTGWLNELGMVSTKCRQLKGSLFHASNFSLGVNILFKINNLLSKIMNNYPEYSINLKEIHHTQKLDKPSGTAISLAEEIISNTTRKSTWSLNLKADNILPIESIRKDPYPGSHIISYESNIDKIKIMHEAKNRQGFALGAILAAEFIIEKKEGIYTMNDLIQF